MAGEVMEQIYSCIDNQTNFLLSGGAGSGKTYTLGKVLDYIYKKNPKASIACMTYTNVAVDEIKERFPYENLRVSTIHDFLWDSIQDYQKNLRLSLYELLIKEKEEAGTGIKYNGDEEIVEGFFNDKKISYKEYKKIEEGIISHDEVLKIANYMFSKYPLLSDIIKDRYAHILIDEYQDTEPQVIQIFLHYLQEQTQKKNLIGFFGDSMQSIYDRKAVGDIKSYIEAGIVQEIFKNDNYRCSKSVINFINKLRNDSIIQEPARKDEYGNIINKEGSVKFVYTESLNLDILKSKDILSSWDFNNTKETKELYLTHKLIANEGGFIDLFSCYQQYSNKDRLIGDNKDGLIKHIHKIIEAIELYDKKDYINLIKNIKFNVLKPSDKAILKKSFDDLAIVSEGAVNDVIQKADELNLIMIDDKLSEFIQAKEDLYNEVKQIAYKQFLALYNYEYDKTPYSTQHGVKGAEFENVLVVLDNGKWNTYNFKHLFEETAGKESIIERTRKIFYVNCSRAINNLVIVVENPSSEMIEQAKSWLGEENVLDLDCL